jgi:hypothetical protein
MSVLANGRYLYYYPSPGVLRILDLWTGTGITLAWEKDDATNQVIAHLTPAQPGDATVPLRKPDVGSAFISLPTIDIGKAVKQPIQTVAEITVTETEIAVRVPFMFEFINSNANV